MTAYVRAYPDAEGSLWLQCPGCEDLHRIGVGTPTGWTWDGNTERPTISPSILVRGVRPKFAPDAVPFVCHSFVRDGHWEFLADSTHALAGQTVPVVPLPDWLAN